jgi:hypothetical protein
MAPRAVDEPPAWEYSQHLLYDCAVYPDDAIPMLVHSFGCQMALDSSMRTLHLVCSSFRSPNATFYQTGFASAFYADY